MPKRKSQYQDKPHVMRDEVRERFEALMEKKHEPEKKSQVPITKGELWRWDTLEDCPEYNT